MKLVSNNDMNIGDKLDDTFTILSFVKILLTILLSSFRPDQNKAINASFPYQKLIISTVSSYAFRSRNERKSEWK